MSKKNGERLRSAIIFDASLTKELSTDSDRLPPNYVGVRRIRPSNEFALDCDSNIKNQSSSTKIVYKVMGEDGVERRMTSKEKKEAKMKRKKEDAALNKQRREQQGQQAAPTSTVSQGTDVNIKEQTERRNQTFYHQLTVSTTMLEEELADLRGDRNGVPPVCLSFPMAMQAQRYDILSKMNVANGNQFEKEDIQIDDDLAEKWSTKLKESMKYAEEIRSNEKMRPMAYQLVPEVWTRLRPPTLLSKKESNSSSLLSSKEDMPVTAPDNSNSTSRKDNTTQCTVLSKSNNVPNNNQNSVVVVKDTGERSKTPNRSLWSYMTIRHRIDPIDSDKAIVYQLLYEQTKLHISTGEKFGCDFLLYKKRREEEHAMAGLRVVSLSSLFDSFSSSSPSTTSSDKEEEKEVDSLSCKLPLPSAYDLAGYVRGLNTAGKLALIATVKRRRCDDDVKKSKYHVAIVDLALEKILSAPTHQKKRKRKNNCNNNKRRDVGLSLSKSNSTG